MLVYGGMAVLLARSAFAADTIAPLRVKAPHYELHVFERGHFAIRVGGVWLPGCVCLVLNPSLEQYDPSDLRRITACKERTEDATRITLKGQLAEVLEFTETIVCTDTRVDFTFTVTALADLRDRNLRLIAGPEATKLQGVPFVVRTVAGTQVGTFPPPTDLALTDVQSITWRGIAKRDVEFSFREAAWSRVNLGRERIGYEAGVFDSEPVPRGTTARVSCTLEVRPYGDVAYRREWAEVRAGFVTFDVGGMGGMLHHYRTDHGNLIQYLNLNEAQHYQSQAGRGPLPHWGGVTFEPTPTGGVVTAAGKIVNQWEERIEAQAVDERCVRTRFHAWRTLDQPQRLRLLVYLSAWMERAEQRFYLLTPDGTLTEDLNEEPLTVGLRQMETEAGLGPYRLVGEFPAGTQVHFPLRDRGEHLILTLAQPFRLATFRFGIHFRGVWFELDRKARELTLTIEHTRSHLTATVGALDLLFNDYALTATLRAGGIPLLLDVSPWEGEVTAASPTAPAWKVEPLVQSPQGVAVRGTGRLVSRWTGEVDALRLPNRTLVTFRWQRVEGGPSSSSPPERGIRIDLPIHLLGTPLAIKPPEEPWQFAVKGIRPRLGAELDLGWLSAGTELGFRPSATERVGLGLGTSAHGQLVRPSRGRAALILVAEDAEELTMTISYARLRPPLTGTRKRGQGPARSTFPPERLTVLRHRPNLTLALPADREGWEEGDLTVRSPWWEVVHAAARGGAIASVRFFYGRNENLLTEPLTTLLQVGETVLADTADSHARLRVLEARPERVVVEVRGRLLQCGTQNAGEGPGLYRGGGAVAQSIPFLHRYEYSLGQVRRTCRYDFGAGVAGVTRFEVGTMHLRSDLTEYAARRDGRDTEWGYCVFPGRPAFSQRGFAEYLAVFERGVEGLDVVQATPRWEWETAVEGAPGGAWFGLVGDAQGQPTVVLAPYARTDAPVTLRGPKEFHYYLSLPRIRPTLPRRHFLAVLHPAELTPDLASALAEAGVNGVLLSIGDRPGSFRAGGEEATRRAVATAHRCRMQVFPFQAFALLNRQVPAWQEHHEEWARMVQKNGQPEPAVYSDYGDYMCFEAAGWREYLKRGLHDLRTRYGFDGLYYDFVHPLACANPRHWPQVHEYTDGLLEMIEWTRREVSPEGIFVGHTGWVPTILFQNLCTVAAVFEEITDDQVPALCDWPANGQFVNATEKTLVSSFLNHGCLGPGEADFRPPRPEDVRAYLARCALTGLFPWLHSGNLGAVDRYDLLPAAEPYLRLFRSFRGLALERMQFADWRRQTAVLTDNPYLRAATYWRGKEAVIVLANSETPFPQQGRFRVQVRHFGWKPVAQYTLEHRPDGETLTVSAETLGREGVPVALEGYDYRVYHLLTS